MTAVAMSLGGIAPFGGSGLPALLAVPLALAAIFLAIWIYRPILRIRDFGPLLPATLVALRLLAVGLAVLLLLGPLVHLDRTPRETRRIAVLVDRSRSMEIRDSIEGRSRAEAAGRLLGGGLLRRLESMAVIDVRDFDAELRTHDTKRRAGESSDLHHALRRAAEESRQPPLRAVVLLSDGAETGTRSVLEQSFPVPVYPIGVGSLRRERPDVAVTRIHVDRQALVAAAVPVRVDLSHHGLPGKDVAVDLLEEGKPIASTAVRLGDRSATAYLSFVPRRPGLFEFEVRARPLAEESIRENNGRFFAIKVTASRLRILYYEGTPRWEYKFLTRELRKDGRLAFQSMLRTNADRLYRTGGDGRSRFSADTLVGVDCLILGDMHREDLTRKEAEAIRRFVLDRGGGLVLLSGKESAATLPALGLGDLMPLDPATTGIVEGSFEVRATKEGVTHPVLLGVRAFPPISVLQAHGGKKPGAQLLALGGSHPLFAAQRYGAGRVLQSATDATWQWVMRHPTKGGEEAFRRFWGQAVRWVSGRSEESPADGPGAQIRTDKEIYRSGETVRVRVRGVKTDSIRVGRREVPLTAGSGGLEGTFRPESSGLHRLSLGGAAHAFFVERPIGEFDRLTLQEDLLRRLARESGGLYYDLAGARDLPEALATTDGLKVRRAEFDLRRSWIPFALLVLLLGAEWVLRKRIQLM